LKEQTLKVFSKDNVFEKNDFIYLNPPYFSTNKHSFTNYLSFGFDSYDHQYVFHWILSLEKEVFFLLQNSYTKQLLDIFSSTNYVRGIRVLTDNLNSQTKSTLKELIITNYNSKT
jgi:site-specific DNA-adenine methylase